MTIRIKQKKYWIIGIILLVFSLALFLLYHFIAYNLQKDNSMDYFNAHRDDFERVAEYFNDNTELYFYADMDDINNLEKIDDLEVENSIRNILLDGDFFSIVNHSQYNSQVEVSFVASNIFINTNDTVAIVYATQLPKDEISYKGDNIEYIDSYEELGDNWYREYRKYKYRYTRQ